MKNTFVKILMSASAISFSLSVHAGSASSGTPHKMHFFNDGKALVYTTGTRTGTPSCATAQPSRFAIDGSTAGGKALLSGVMEANATGKNIVIYGTGACSVVSNSETIDYIYVDD